MPNQTPFRRQLKNLQLIREWHLQSSLNAQVEGRREEAKYHSINTRFSGQQWRLIRVTSKFCTYHAFLVMQSRCSDVI